MNHKSTVLAGQIDQVIWIKVEGRGTFQISTGFKEYVCRMIQRGHRHFVVDLAQCELMDSTFIGTIAGIALRLRELGTGQLCVLHANLRNEQLFENLGLDHFFSTTLPEDFKSSLLIEKPLHPESSDPAFDEQVRRATMIAAHETLIAIAPENEARFRDVLDLLKQEIDL